MTNKVIPIKSVNAPVIIVENKAGKENHEPYFPYLVKTVKPPPKSASSLWERYGGMAKACIGFVLVEWLIIQVFVDNTGFNSLSEYIIGGLVILLCSAIASRYKKDIANIFVENKAQKK